MDRSQTSLRGESRNLREFAPASDDPGLVDAVPSIGWAAVAQFGKGSMTACNGKAAIRVTASSVWGVAENGRCRTSDTNGTHPTSPALSRRRQRAIGLTTLQRKHLGRI